MAFADVQVSDPGRRLSTIAEQLRASAGRSESPYLIMLCGLPLTGKSYLARLLSVELHAAIVGTDHVRKTFYPAPTYSADESANVHMLCYTLIEVLLFEHIPLIFDATNQYEWQRRRVADMCERIGARLIVVEVTASQAVVRQRLERRAARPEGAGDPFDMSDADRAGVYERMLHTFQPVSGPHLAVDTGEDEDLNAALDAIVAKVNALPGPPPAGSA